MAVHWLIVVTIIMVFFQAYLFKKWGLAGVSYNRYFTQNAVFEGNDTEMVEEIVNRKLLPIPWLRLESKMSSHLSFNKQASLAVLGDQFHRSFFSLMAFQKIRRRHKLTCRKRGYYQLRTASISVGDPFGIDQKSKTVNLNSDLIVYPKLLPIDNILLPTNSWQGDIIVRRWIMDDPFVFAGVRDYTYGDTMKSVNWSATARTGRLQVSKNDYTADHKIMIYLNFDETEDIWKSIKDEDLFEKGISYAASIAEYTISKGIPTGFGCNAYIDDPLERLKKRKDSIRIEGKNGKGHLMYILETMAMLRIDRSMNFNHFLQEDVERKRRDTDILLITTFVSETMEKHIRTLRVLGNSIEIVDLNQFKTRETINQDGPSVGEQHG
ncbi:MULTISPECIES: DUF58 domain-containing protein [Bacillaceae]|uniref:DUF58 domain-containing protein n=1 Tax=Evansella alkalicola TaxID=745819 RepID=A0ABS6JTZ0_9BACI|nr:MULTISPECIES: DUF58 domain-containing protein [Bacillaceae]MBU9722051.1 DUF58 domain-containing protein [Bacillus alkalicola]